MTITKNQVGIAEDQIYLLRKSVKYDIRELTIEIIVNKYETGMDYQDDDFEYKIKSRNVLFIPDYQRDFTWDTKRQAKFIESILLGLPIPLVFVAENRNSAWEIVDGSQRIRTLHAFVKNQLSLEGLDKIDTLNSFFFKDLDSSRQGKFLDTPLRMIVLSEDADDEVKRDMFERINRGSDLLKPMEKRKGDKIGLFTDFIYDLCANSEKVKPEYKEASQLLYELTPIDKWLQNRQEREALVLRYFALSDKDNYAHFPQKGIESFLDDYLDAKNKAIKNLSGTEQQIFFQEAYTEFLNVLKYVKSNSRYGFRRSHNPQTKRVIFEAIAVGVHVALKKQPNLLNEEHQITNIVTMNDFRPFWQGNTHLHDASKVKGRVNFIANKLLKI